MKKVLLAALAILVCSLSAFGQGDRIRKYQILEYEENYYQMIVNVHVRPDFTANLYRLLCQILFKEQASSIEEGFNLFIEHNAKDYIASPKRSKMAKKGLTKCRYNAYPIEYVPGRYATIAVEISNNLMAILPNGNKGNEKPEVSHVFTYDMEHDRLLTPENVFVDPSIVKDKDNLLYFWAEKKTVCMVYNYEQDNSFTYQIKELAQYLTPEFKELYNKPKPQVPQINQVATNASSTGETIKTKEVMAQENVGEQIFVVVETMPQFPGGEAALFKYLSTNIKYPPIAEENGVQGRVIVSFVVERDGSISNVKVIKHVDPSLDREAVRVVSTMPKWTPGTQNGETVRVKHTVPMTFRLQ